MFFDLKIWFLFRVITYFQIDPTNKISWKHTHCNLPYFYDLYLVQWVFFLAASLRRWPVQNTTSLTSSLSVWDYSAKKNETKKLSFHFLSCSGSCWGVRSITNFELTRPTILSVQEPLVITKRIFIINVYHSVVVGQRINVPSTADVPTAIISSHGNVLLITATPRWRVRRVIYWVQKVPR